MTFANQVIERCGSTNDLAKELAGAGYPHGTWISARKQDCGRGRLGRKWESIEGNLFLSVILKIEKKSLWTWIPLTSAIAVVEYLRRQFCAYPPIQVKWPNDIWLDGRKLGGILCEGTRDKSGSSIIVGIGINCQGVPEGFTENAIDLSSLSPGKSVTSDQPFPVDPGEGMSGRGLHPAPLSARVPPRPEGRGFPVLDEIRMGIISNLLERMQDLLDKGPIQTKDLYEAWTAFPKGTEVEWGFPSQSGRVQGLGPLGELQVETSDGCIKSLFAEDVKLRLRARCPNQAGAV